MKKLILSFAFVCVFTGAMAQENRISTNKIDSLPTPSAAERVVVPTAGQKLNAAKRRSTSEMDAEMRSKAKTQSQANAKPNPYEKPLSEPTPAPSAGSGAGKSANTPPQTK